MCMPPRLDVLVLTVAYAALAPVAHAQEAIPHRVPLLHPELLQQVTERERSFARSMADRDFAAFTHQLSQTPYSSTARSRWRGDRRCWTRGAASLRAPMRLSRGSP